MVVLKKISSLKIKCHFYYIYKHPIIYYICGVCISCMTVTSHMTFFQFLLFPVISRQGTWGRLVLAGPECPWLLSLVPTSRTCPWHMGSEVAESSALRHSTWCSPSPCGTPAPLAPAPSHSVGSRLNVPQPLRIPTVRASRLPAAEGLSVLTQTRRGLAPHCPRD